MQGISGTYSLNGTAFLLPPTESGWVDRNLLGVTGNSHPTYPALRSYEMTWEWMSAEEFEQIRNVYKTVQTTGTIVADLPKYATSPFQFYSYSGCTMKEPTAGKYFETYVEGVTLLLLRVRAI